MKNIRITSIILFLIIGFSTIKTANCQRITISGTTFVINGKEIVLNGANTPWNKWNDFGGGYNSLWWDNEFKRLKNAGANCTRIWISCNGDVGMTLGSDGTMISTTSLFWTHLDDMFRLAEKHKIYIMATLLSFDHFKNSHASFQSWRNMIMSNDKLETLVNKYIIPFTIRYRNNPYLFAIDICNEPEWVNQNAECGQIPWARLQYLVARTASAIHDSSKVLVTLGSAAVKWNSPRGEGNFWSDASLKAQYNKPNARLDFYSPHFYGWVVKWFGNFAVDKSPADYGINDRPCLIGENPAKGVFNDGASPTLVVPASEMFIKSYLKGWKGLMPWTSNGVDSNGSLSDFESGLKAFKSKYPELIEPVISTGFNFGPDIKSNEHHELKIFPNPSSGDFFITLTDWENSVFELVTPCGKLLCSKTAESEKTRISPGTIRKGICFLKIRKPDGQKTYKVILV
jgi:hypothetical protein